MVTNERYARADTSVTGQILKIVAVRPDAVMTGGSGTQGALPLLALGERGFKGKAYGTVALINPDFVRVGGKAAEGIQVSAGPVIVAEQLPDSHFAKKLALDFRAAFLKANNVADHRRVLGLFLRRLAGLRDAAARALKTAKPGTAEFRKALRDAILTTKEVAGMHARLQLQGRRLLRRRRARAGDRPPDNGAWTYEP